MEMEKMPVGKLLLKLSPPVMLALLIQSIYNIVDSFFIGRYAAEGLTALSVIYPLQLLITSVATGTGAGIGILVSRLDGEGKEAGVFIRNGLLTGVLNYILFAAAGMLVLRPYFAMSSDNPLVREMGVSYGGIVILFSAGCFIEANCSKILQARGNTLLPMAAQVLGALLNIVLDPVLIFGLFGCPEMGVAGAAIATVAGQWAAMAVTLTAVLRGHKRSGKASLRAMGRIYRCGLPSIFMQSLYTLYIIGLNLILAGFTEDAVTVLGIYYKLQAFFFIPLMGLQQVILPVISFNHGAGLESRVRETVKWAVGISAAVAGAGTAVFLTAPEALLRIFSQSEGVLAAGVTALRIIGTSFVPAGIGMMLTVYFQGVGKGAQSMLLTLVRQVFLLVPVAWALHFFGLTFVWLTFPITEVAVLVLCAVLWKRQDAGRTAVRVHA